jgi:hypothetical protein
MLFIPDFATPWMQAREAAINANWADRARFADVYNADMRNVGTALNLERSLTQQPGYLANDRAWSEMAIDVAPKYWPQYGANALKSLSQQDWAWDEARRRAAAQAANNYGIGPRMPSPAAALSEAPTVRSSASGGPAMPKAAPAPAANYNPAASPGDPSRVPPPWFNKFWEPTVEEADRAGRQTAGGMITVLTGGLALAPALAADFGLQKFKDEELARTRERAQAANWSRAEKNRQAQEYLDRKAQAQSQAAAQARAAMDYPVFSDAQILTGAVTGQPALVMPAPQAPVGQSGAVPSVTLPQVPVGQSGAVPSIVLPQAPIGQSGAMPSITLPQAPVSSPALSSRNYSFNQGAGPANLAARTAALKPRSVKAAAKPFISAARAQAQFDSLFG